MANKFKLGAVSALLAAALYNLPAQAAAVSYNFTATIWDELQTEDYGGGTTQMYSSDFSGHTITLGDHIVGSFSYDPAAARLTQPQPGDASDTRRYFDLPGFSLHYTIVPSGASFASDGAPGSAWVQNNLPSRFAEDRFVVSGKAEHSGGMQREAGLQFFDNNGSALPGTNVPFNLGADKFPNRDLFASWQRDSDGHQFSLIASIDTMVAAPVPEPTNAAMLLAGLGTLTLLARRRRQG